MIFFAASIIHYASMCEVHLTLPTIRYKTPRPYFHTFEGDDAQIGLNFAGETLQIIFPLGQTLN